MKKFIALVLALLLSLSAALAEDAPRIGCSKNGELIISVSGNPTTGYAWWATLLTDGVAKLENPDGDYVEDPHEEDMVGVGGTYTFRLSPLAAGETLLHLKYFRSFERKTEMEKLFLILVDEEGNIQAQELSEIAPLEALVTEVNEQERTALVKDGGEQEILVHFPGDMALPAVDEQVRIFYNGVITMSLPGQISCMGWESVPTAEMR